jgi:hypothetical protein
VNDNFSGAIIMCKVNQVRGFSFITAINKFILFCGLSTKGIYFFFHKNINPIHEESVTLDLILP